jgi:hypothetical protein
MKITITIPTYKKEQKILTKHVYATFLKNKNIYKKLKLRLKNTKISAYFWSFLISLIMHGMNIKLYVQFI